MTAVDWNGLLGNFAVVTLVVVVWATVRDLLTDVPRELRMLLFGLAMGAGAAICIKHSIQLAPGILFDLRAVPVALASFFGGFVGGAGAAAISAGLRLWMGGAGQWAGVLSIVITTLIGLAGHLMMRGRDRERRHILLLAVAVSAGGMSGTVLLPAALRWEALQHTLGPAALLTFMGTAATGFILLQDQKRRAAAARNSIYKTIFDALPDSLNIKDIHGCFLAANPATAALMRAPSADALVGRTDADFYPAAVAERLGDEEAAVLAADGPRIIEQEISFEDGRSAWLETLKMPLRTSGRVIGLITHNRDVTESKRLRDGLDQARRRLDDALMHMVDAFAIFDADGQLLVANDQYRALFPRTADLRRAGTHYRTILRAAVERGEKSVDASAAEAWVEATVMELRRPGEKLTQLDDGRWIEYRISILDDGNSLFVGMDVTARKRAEAILAASEARYRLIAENAADFVVRIGRDARCQFATPASRELLGYEPEEMLGRHALGIVSVGDRPTVALAMDRVFRGEIVSNLEFLAARKDGATVWVEVSARPLASGDGFVLAVRDISQRKATERELAVAVEQLEYLASTDSLTGLATRRIFEQRLEHELARSMRERTTLSLILVDVDRFKAYNDTYGHPAGDECLRQVAQALRTALRRPADTAARYGGEEMVALLPNTDAAGAAAVAESFRAAVRDLAQPHAGSEYGVVTVSVGVASTGAGAAALSAHDLLRWADEALYGAKHGGRNRVVQARAA